MRERAEWWGGDSDSRLGARPASVAIVRQPINPEKEKDKENEKDWILADARKAGIGIPARQQARFSPPVRRPGATHWEGR